FMALVTKSRTLQRRLANERLRGLPYLTRARETASLRSTRACLNQRRRNTENVHEQIAGVTARVLDILSHTLSNSLADFLCALEVIRARRMLNDVVCIETHGFPNFVQASGSMNKRLGYLADALGDQTAYALDGRGNCARGNQAGLSNVLMLG